ncbi:MAG: ATP/GTP-binding protein [Longicatena sp.]
MLIQFKFKNFKSFRDDAILDLSATKISEYNDRVIEIGGEKILPVAAIFGANASGKSNIQQAFSYMVYYVMRSFAFGGDVDEKKNKSEFVHPTPFLFDHTSKDAPSTFEVYFNADEADKNKQYNYGFSVDNCGVCEEWLNVCAKSSRRKYISVFYRNRDNNELDLSGLPKKAHDNIETALESETLIVSLGAKLKIDILKFIRDWFLKHDVTDFGNPLQNLLMSKFIPNGFDEDEIVRHNVIHYFSSFDESIIDFEVEKTKDENDEEYLNIKTLHKAIGSDDKIAIPLREESAGTLKMFALYPALKEVMESGGVLFVDELNSRLHPLLLRNFLISFLDPKVNKNHAQIIFTTHDSWTLSNNLLRRDEIWFTQKDRNGISSLYSLADFTDDIGTKIRKDENYEKNYLLGKYGAIPELKSMMVMEDD